MDEELEAQAAAGKANFSREKGITPMAVPLDSRTNSFAHLLPGEVARRFKAAIFGTPGGPTYFDESDDEDDSGDNRREQGHSSSNNDSEPEQSVNGRKRSAKAQAPDQRQNAKNYNTFGYDADVENVRAANE